MTASLDTSTANTTQQIQGQHGTYSVPENTLEFLIAKDYSPKSLRVTIDALDRLYAHLAEQYVNLSTLLEETPESLRKKGAEADREKIAAQQRELESYCVQIRARRDGFIEHENYLRLTSVPASHHIPNSFG